MSGAVALGVQRHVPSGACGMQRALQASVGGSRPIRVMRTRRPFKDSLRATGIPAKLRGRPEKVFLNSWISELRPRVDAF